MFGRCVRRPYSRTFVPGDSRSKRVKTWSALSDSTWWSSAADRQGWRSAHYLARQQRDFVILDALARVGDAWRARWDGLRLFTSGRLNGLPGMPFPGDPHGSDQGRSCRLPGGLCERHGAASPDGRASHRRVASGRRPGISDRDRRRRLPGRAGRRQRPVPTIGPASRTSPKSSTRRSRSSTRASSRTRRSSATGPSWSSAPATRARRSR